MFFTIELGSINGTLRPHLQINKGCFYITIWQAEVYDCSSWRVGHHELVDISIYDAVLVIIKTDLFWKLGSCKSSHICLFFWSMFLIRCNRTSGTMNRVKSPSSSLCKFNRCAHMLVSAFMRSCYFSSEIVKQCIWHTLQPMGQHCLLKHWSTLLVLPLNHNINHPSLSRWKDIFISDAASQKRLAPDHFLFHRNIQPCDEVNIKVFNFDQ